MSIEFKEGAVCYASKREWRSLGGSATLFSDRKKIGLHYKSLSKMLECEDFQLNEPASGYYIPKSELDTEEKYNRAVEEFGLFGHDVYDKTSGFDGLQAHNSKGLGLYINKIMNIESHNVKINFDQLMAIGELKRKMNDRDDTYIKNADADKLINTGSAGGAKDSKPKSKEAYRILESMGIEWDNTEVKWFKVSKEWL